MQTLRAIYRTQRGPSPACSTSHRLKAFFVTLTAYAAVGNTNNFFLNARFWA
jgi:hypothetical protein